MNFDACISDGSRRRRETGPQRTAFVRVAPAVLIGAAVLFSVSCDADPAPGGPNPTTPAVTIAAEVSGNSVTVKWNAPADDRAVKEYVLRVRDSRGKAVSFLAGDGRILQVAVVSKDEVGNSYRAFSLSNGSYTAEISIIGSNDKVLAVHSSPAAEVNSQASAPGNPALAGIKVGDMKVEGQGEQAKLTVALSWTPPADTGKRADGVTNSPIRRYTVAWGVVEAGGISPGGQQVVDRDANGAVPTVAEVGNLDPAKIYRFAVRAANDADLVSREDAASGTTAPAWYDREKRESVLTTITARHSPQNEFAEESIIYDGNMVPIGSSKDGYGIWKDTGNLYRGRPSYKFYMKNDDADRVEFTSVFVTQSHIKEAKLTQKQIDDNKAAKSLYYYGTGFCRRGVVWTYEYGMMLPSSLNADSKGIASQWHGVPDRKTVLAPDGTITKYSLEDFNSKILSKMYFKENIGYDIGTTVDNKYRIDQGGYPPLSLVVRDGYLHLKARVDYKRITDKTDRINIGPLDDPPSRTSSGGTKEVHIIWKKRLEDLPSDQWMDVKFEINWSKWSDDGLKSKPISDGSVKLYLDNQLMVDWKGAIGNNDARPTYFKYGIYKPGSTGIEVWLSEFKQYGPNGEPPGSAEEY